MSMQNNNTSKTDPYLNPKEAQDPQTYSLMKLAEMEAYLLDGIEVVKGCQKRCYDLIQSQL